MIIALFLFLAILAVGLLYRGQMSEEWREANPIQSKNLIWSAALFFGSVFLFILASSL